MERWEIGSRKPDSKAYQIAAEALGLTPAQCVFVDDLPVNVDAAKELGMTGILMSDAPEAAAALLNSFGLPADQ